MDEYIVYVRTDDVGRIVAVCSSAYLTDTEGWNEIDRGRDHKHYHAQGNYFDNCLTDDRGIFRYKLEDGKPVERTQEEMNADYTPPVPKPSDAERIAALEEQLAAYEAAYLEGVNEA